MAKTPMKKKATRTPKKTGGVTNKSGSGKKAVGVDKLNDMILQTQYEEAKDELLALIEGNPSQAIRLVHLIRSGALDEKDEDDEKMLHPSINKMRLLSRDMVLKCLQSSVGAMQYGALEKVRNKSHLLQVLSYLSFVDLNCALPSHSIETVIAAFKFHIQKTERNAADVKVEGEGKHAEVKFEPGVYELSGWDGQFFKTVRHRKSGQTTDLPEDIVVGEHTHAFLNNWSETTAKLKGKAKRAVIIDVWDLFEEENGGGHKLTTHRPLMTETMPDAKRGLDGGSSPKRRLRRKRSDGGAGGGASAASAAAGSAAAGVVAPPAGWGGFIPPLAAAGSGDAGNGTS